MLCRNRILHAVFDALRQTAISDTIAAEAIAKMQIADIASTRAKAQLREIAKVVGVRGRIGRWLLKFNGSSLFGVGRNVLCGQLQIELSGEQVDHRLEVSD
jgi:hypothetical protein